MKKQVNKKALLVICIIIAALLVWFGIELARELADTKVTKEMSLEECQVFVDETLSSLPVSTAEGSKYVIKNTKVTVNSIEYGNEKDIILHCSYSTINSKAALEPNIQKLLYDAYQLCAKREASGKKTSGTDISVRAEFAIMDYLKNAEKISGTVTLHIYETSKGLQLHLDDEMVDICTGGMISIYKKIKDSKTIIYEGQTIDITTKATIGRGVSDPINLTNHPTDKPFTGGPILEAWKDFKSDFHENFIVEARYQYLIKGLGTTLLITLFSALFGIALGFIIAIVRCTNQMTGKLSIIDAICRFYLTVIRGTPVMVQLLILYYVALAPMGVEKYTAAVICFGLNSGAYVAEIVRGGIMSVDKGQIEAGRSLGFNYVQTMVHFVVPQAFKAIVPSLANEFITLLKESSVAFAIGVSDLTFGGNLIRSRTYSPFLPLLAVALIYLLLVVIMTKLVGILERRLAKSDH